MSKDIYIDKNDGIECVKVTWYHIGLKSTMKTDMWLKSFPFIGNGRATSLEMGLKRFQPYRFLSRVVQNLILSHINNNVESNCSQNHKF